MGEWKESKLGQLVTLNYGKALKEEDRILGDIPVFSSGGLTGWHNKAIINSKGIIVGRKGTIGKVYLTKKEFFCIDTAYYILPNDELYDLNFLYFKIKTIGLEDLNSDSAVPGLNRDAAYSQTLLLPPLPEQRAIAAVLSSLDDKIDLLHRQNKTLQTMAETLYRQWFVEEADDGWEIGKLGDVIELHYGKGLKSEERTGTGFPVVGSSGIVDFHQDFLVEGPGIVIGRKGTLGKVVYLWENFYPIDTTYFVKSKVKSIGLLYEYYLLKTINFEEMNTDSAVPGLNREIALSTDIFIAPEIFIHKFNNFVAPMVAKMRKNFEQINTLEKLRDTLLPKLMSGEVRVELDPQKDGP